MFLLKLTIHIWKSTWYLISLTNIVHKITLPEYLALLKCLHFKIQYIINLEIKFLIWLNLYAPPPIYFYEIVMNFDFVPYLFSNWEIDTKGGTNTKEEGISFLTYQFWHSTFDLKLLKNTIFKFNHNYSNIHMLPWNMPSFYQAQFQLASSVPVQLRTEISLKSLWDPLHSPTPPGQAY